MLGSPRLSAAAQPHGSLVKVAAAPNGAQRLTYRVGPFNVIPGQNDIGYQGMDQKPKVDGWITRIRPDLIYPNGKVPRVDVIHLHHGVWLNMSEQDVTSRASPSASSRRARRRRSCPSRRATACRIRRATGGCSTT